MGAEEPLFCTLCGAEDFSCGCNVDCYSPIIYCEVCGNRLENDSCSECDRRRTVKQP